MLNPNILGMWLVGKEWAYRTKAVSLLAGDQWWPFFVIQFYLVIEIMYLLILCTTIHRYPIFSTRHFVTCKVYTGHHGTSEIEHGLCACTVDNPLAKARGLSLRTGAQTMLYLSHILTK